MTTIRKKIQPALDKPTYEEAKESINKVRDELALINESAVRSLDESIEAIMMEIERRTRRKQIPIFERFYEPAFCVC